MFITDRIVIPSVDICSSSLNFKKMAKGWRIVGAVSISTSFCAQTEPCPGPVLFLAVKGFRFSAPYCSSRGIQNSTDTDEVAQCSALIREKGSSRLQSINLKIISTCIKINLILKTYKGQECIQTMLISKIFSTILKLQDLIRSMKKYLNIQN